MFPYRPYYRCLATFIAMPPKMNRKGKKGGRKSKQIQNLPLVATPPPGSRAILSYYTKGTLTEGAAGVGGSYFFRLNSVYDPDASGVGTSAIPYATWAALYLNYKVRRVTVRVMASFAGSAGSLGRLTIAPVAYQPVVPANAATWVMLPFASSRMMAVATEGGKNVAEITRTYDMPRIAKITRAQFSNELDWSGQVGSNPARQIYLLLGLESVNSSTVGSAKYSIYITYEVEWFNPVPMQ